MPRTSEQETADTAAKKRTYTVKPGDTLSKIAGALLGNPDRWTEIFELNKGKIKDANTIQPGLELVIPK
ncbi:MAG: LysM peptidoglycan-binding domain-containing protein [Anaerolineales bacterium]|nr:LysM peptidoglycan-binding domain-containing protein [Anaerolineales bacterium]